MKKKSKKFKKRGRFEPNEWLSEKEYLDYLKNLDRRRFEVESRIVINEALRYIELVKKLKRDGKKLKYIG